MRLIRPIKLPAASDPPAVSHVGSQFAELLEAFNACSGVSVALIFPSLFRLLCWGNKNGTSSTLKVKTEDTWSTKLCTDYWLNPHSSSWKRFLLIHIAWLWRKAAPTFWTVSKTILRDTRYSSFPLRLGAYFLLVALEKSQYASPWNYPRWAYTKIVPLFFLRYFCYTLVRCFCNKCNTYIASMAHQLTLCEQWWDE